MNHLNTWEQKFTLKFLWGKMEQVKILIADDHAVLRAGLKSVIQTNPQYTIVAEADSGTKAVQLTDELSPDIVIMDIGMQRMNGLEASKTIKENHPETKILILTMHDNYNYVIDALSIGINGYLLKMSDMNEVFMAIERIMSGEDYFAREVTFNTLKNIEKSSHQESLDQNSFYLTKREKEVLKLIAEGHTYKKIAEILFISHYTVINHRQNIIQKLGFSNNAELVKFAIKHGFLKNE